MQTDGALVELARIVDAVHRLEGVDGARMGWVHFQVSAVSRLQVPSSSFWEITR